MKIIARKCPWTGRLFTEEQYSEHLRSMRHEFKRKRELARAEASFKDFYSVVHRMATIDEITEWLNQHFIEYAHQFYKTRGSEIPRRKKATIVFSFLDLRWDENCQTTHCAPRGQTTTGWRNRHVPEPGWRGRIQVDMTGGGYDLFESNLLSPLGIHTGTGGGCDERLRYEVTLFAKDFRIMARPKMLEKLSAE